MRLVPFLISFFLPILIGTNVLAQNNPGQQIFDMFRGQLDREINRQQQRAFEKQQQQQNEAVWQAYLAAWNDCFQSRAASSRAAMRRFRFQTSYRMTAKGSSINESPLLRSYRTKLANGRPKR